MRFALFLLMMSGTMALASDEKLALIDAMNDNGCMMTSAQADVQMPALGIDRAMAKRFRGK